MLPIVEDVREAIAHLRGGPEWAREVPIVEHAAAMARRRVDQPRGRNPERLHAPGKRHPIAGLDDQMNVTALDADVNDVKYAVDLRGRRTHGGLPKCTLVVRKRGEGRLFDRPK